jgi:hypothetical protein
MAGAGGGASRPAARVPPCCCRPGGGPRRRCGFTFYGVTAPMTAPWSPLMAEVAVPVLVGVADTLWGGSAAAGRPLAITDTAAFAA